VVERAVYKTNGPVITRIDFSPFSSPFDPLPAPGTSSIEQVENRTAALSADGKLIRDTEKALGNDEYAALPLAELAGLPLKKAVLALERFRLSQALIAARFNQKAAAANLGVSYDQFRGLKKKHRM